MNQKNQQGSLGKLQATITRLRLKISEQENTIQQIQQTQHTNYSVSATKARAITRSHSFPPPYTSCHLPHPLTIGEDNSSVEMEEEIDQMVEEKVDDSDTRADVTNIDSAADVNSTTYSDGSNIDVANKPTKDSGGYAEEMEMNQEN